jgi:ABC-type transport system substrate-binding protein
MRTSRILLAATASALLALGCQRTVYEAPPSLPEFRQPQVSSIGLSSYKIGMLGEATTDNFWAAQDLAASIWNNYVLAPTKPALFRVNFPGIELESDLAATTALPRAIESREGWVVSVPIRKDAIWSDGTPITSADVVFTFETVRDLGLGGNWRQSYPLTNSNDPDQIGLIRVEAAGDSSVRFVFNRAPGLAVWPHGVGVAPIMPAHFWSEGVARAISSPDPVAALYQTSGRGDPSGGPMIFDELEAGAFAHSTANSSYYGRSEVIESGGLGFEDGPFVSDTYFSLYRSQEAALMALRTGEIDYIMNPLGMPRGFLGSLDRDPDLSMVANGTNGFRYLAFNLRRPPMNIPEFRDALALMIDREFMAESVFQGAAIPLYSSIPQGNQRWFNQAASEEFASAYVGKSTGERLGQAVSLLRSAGFSWEVEPAMDRDAVIAGSGVRYRGDPLPPLEILAPGPGYDPLRATYAIWIETWLEQLGFEAEANPTAFDTLIRHIYVPVSKGELDFDMFILGWTLGNPAWPTHHEAFWSSRHDTLTTGGTNATGFNDPDFERLLDRYNATSDFAEAYELLWSMERVIADEKPYVILFDSGIVEIYRETSITYPFVKTLSGIQNLEGMQSLVRSLK